MQTEDKTATIYTESRMTLDSLKKKQHSNIRYGRNKKEIDGDEENRLENSILLLKFTSGSREMS